MDPVSNTPARLSCLTVAGRMGLSERRVSELLSRAMRAYPMPADPEPVEVLYEDEDLIGVNKPPGEWQESDGGRGPGVMSIACSRADDWA